MESIYEKIGSNRLERIVNHFYDLIYASEIADLFKGEKETIAQKQFEFLSQFLGGPGIYSEKYGHPKMRMRHLPHAIDTNAKDVWLACMHEAIHHTIPENKDLADELYACFPRVAAHMINQ